MFTVVNKSASTKPFYFYIAACSSSPCKYPATCTDGATINDYTCTCTAGYSGTNCDTVAGI